MKTRNVRVLVSSEILAKPLQKLKIKISSHWVPIYLVNFASQTRAKINKMSICRYHNAIVDCSTSLQTKFHSSETNINDSIIIAEYGIYLNIFKIVKL